MSNVPDVARDFATHYRGCEVDPVRSDSVMLQVQSLRYDVYCRECHFLNARDYPDHLESDEYDAQSAHFAAFGLDEGLAGYVRLVRPDAIESFPFQNHCVELLEGIQLPPAVKSAEISRLMVRENLRRRRGDLVTGGSTGDSAPPPAFEQRDSSPQILLSLYREMYAHSLRNGIRYWYAAMERSLARVLSRMKFCFQQIGPATNYFGPVAPYMADLRELEVGLARSNPALLAWMQVLPGNYLHDEPDFIASQIC